MPSLDDLRRPAALDDEQWAVIQRHIGRIHRSRVERDWEQAIGSAKELCESVAKLILAARGESFGSNARFDALITGAHRALERQPGAGLATDPPIRDIAQAAKSLALRVNSLRSTHGTGHGHALPSGVVEEHSDIACDAAFTWTRWALRRLDIVIAGRAGDLIRDLRSANFSRGELASRLTAADIPSLDPSEQRALGVAVGRRSASRTFVVRGDGMEAALADDEQWTDAYRAGLVEGAFISEDGYIRADAPAAAAALRILELLGPNAQDIAHGVVCQSAEADVSYAMSADDRTAVKAAVLSGASNFPEPTAGYLRALAFNVAQN